MASFLELSWSAVSAGWSDGFLTVTDVRTLAEARIVDGEGEALVPLSDLASLRDEEAQREVQRTLDRLAALEGRPAYFARREWQVFRLEWQLDHLDEEIGWEERGYNAYYQTRALEWAWRGMGQPLDAPLLDPFIPYVEPTYTTAGLALTVRDLRAWLDQQRQVLAAVSHLLAAGQGQALAVMASAFEGAQANAEAHLNLVQGERAIYQRLLPDEQNGALWREVGAYNSAVLEARRQRSGQPDSSS